MLARSETTRGNDASPTSFEPPGSHRRASPISRRDDGVASSSALPAPPLAPHGSPADDFADQPPASALHPSGTRISRRPRRWKLSCGRVFAEDEPLVIFDIGSCEGEDTIRYARLFPKARVSPSSRCLPTLRSCARTSLGTRPTARSRSLMSQLPIVPATRPSTSRQDSPTTGPLRQIGTTGTNRVLSSRPTAIGRVFRGSSSTKSHCHDHQGRRAVRAARHPGDRLHPP